MASADEITSGNCLWENFYLTGVGKQIHSPPESIFGCHSDDAKRKTALNPTFSMIPNLFQQPVKQTLW
jgi:hypothetical protein